MISLDIVKKELVITHQYQSAEKDILIVVHNQLECLKECITSIQNHTKDYHLYIWDNDSNQETKDYLSSLDAIVITNPTNIGFVVPNNELAKLSKSTYLILLNSDTIVYENWDEAIISHLQHGYDQVGYCGGILDENCIGKYMCFGEHCDYICGWCFGITREIYNEFGLFDEENIKFAYGEDSDFSLRLKENNKKIYALHLGLVEHLQNMTAKNVNPEKLEKTFLDNHVYLEKRWRKSLFNKELSLSLVSAILCLVGYT